jgi:hypothetical protein
MKASSLFVLTYPAALPLAILRTWCLGRLCLGYWPRPSLDDPKSIGLWVDVSYYHAVGLLVLGLPAFGAGIAHLLYQAIRDREKRRALFLQCLCSTAALMTALLLLRQDPLGVTNWFMD